MAESQNPIEELLRAQKASPSGPSFAQPSADALQIEPMSVGRIVDKSLRLSPELFKSLLVFVVIVAALDGVEIMGEYLAGEERKGLLVGIKVLSLANRYLSAVVYILSILFAAKIWRGETPQLSECRSQITFRRIVSGGLLSLMISIVTGFGLLLLIVPGLLYFLNRALAYPILYLENVGRSTAMARSLFLMKQKPWYKGGSPVARLSLLFGIQLFTTGVASFAIVIAPIWIQRAGVNLYIQSIAAFAGGLILEFLAMFATLSIVGFYLDLRARYEGQDLLQSLEG